MSEQDEEIPEPTVHIFGGGTIYRVRPHHGLCAEAYGTVARQIQDILLKFHGTIAKLHMTKMAGARKGMATNADVAKRVDELVADPNTKVIFMSAALCDFEGQVIQAGMTFQGHLPSGNDQPRLKTEHGEHMMRLTPAAKVVDRIRKTRKDIFLVAFKATAGDSAEEQYEAGLKLLNKASCNLVLANDTITRRNMVITPERARYHDTTDRDEAIRGLVDMAMLRSRLHFTRSTIVDGDPVPWDDSRVPGNLRVVVDHCVERGAYKTFLGSTVGHFAVKLGDGKFLTSRRRTDFNRLYAVGLVLVEAEGDDRVLAYGSRPSVGGQSQRIIFAEHPDTDCIVHFHCPLKPGSQVPVRSQREFECGSHECGRNASTGLQKFDLGSEQHLYAVMLDQHGPNVVFNRNVGTDRLIQFIEENFDLARATDGF